MRRLVPNFAFSTNKKLAPNCNRPTSEKGWCHHTKLSLWLVLAGCFLLSFSCRLLLLLLACSLLAFCFCTLLLHLALAPCFFFLLPNFFLLASCKMELPGLETLPLPVWRSVPVCKMQPAGFKNITFATPKQRDSEGWMGTRRCGAKHMSKSKCAKHTSFGAPLKAEMFKKCTPLRRQSTYGSETCERLTVSDHFWKFT